MKNEQERIITVGPYALNFRTQEVTVRGTTISLSAMEFRVFSLLEPEQFHSVQSIANYLRTSTDAVEQIIAEIRDKFGEDEVIQTKRRTGYRLRI
jgi:DNA-binding response OmpR family regulator